MGVGVHDELRQAFRKPVKARLQVLRALSTLSLVIIITVAISINIEIIITSPPCGGADYGANCSNFSF